MKMIKRILIGIFCLGLFSVSTPVFAAEQDDATKQAEELLEQSMNLDANSPESIETFSNSLNNWDTSSSLLDQYGLSQSLLSGANNQNNIQFIFAQLQQQQAQSCKQQAQDYLDKIEKLQNEQEEVATLLEQLRALRDEVVSSSVSKALTDEIKEKLISYGIYDANDVILTKALTKEEIDEVIDETIKKQESLGSSTQTNMTYLQDFMSQYNQFLQDSNNALKSAQAQNGASTVSGTMMSGNLGMFFTGILMGAFATIVIVFFIQKNKNRKNIEENV